MTVAALVRQISSSRFSVDRPMNKKETDACYSRIAAKLEKTNNVVSMDAIDRTVTYLQEIGLTKRLALSAVAMHPMVRSLGSVCSPLSIIAVRSHSVNDDSLTLRMCSHGR